MNQSSGEVKTQCYISTGELRVMCTLWIRRFTHGGPCIEHYIQNLCENEAQAEFLAKEYAAQTGFEYIGIFDSPNQERATPTLKATRLAEWKIQNPAVLTEIEYARSKNIFIVEMEHYLETHGYLSPGQVNAVFKIAAEERRREEERATATPVVTGKAVVITGVVLSTKAKEGYYGIEWKMVVKDDRGFKVWGTLPQSFRWSTRKYLGCGFDGVVGHRVQFVADIVQSKDDPTFGFFTRPRKTEELNDGQQAEDVLPVAR